MSHHYIPMLHIFPVKKTKPSYTDFGLQVTGSCLKYPKGNTFWNLMSNLNCIYYIQKDKCHPKKTKQFSLAIQKRQIWRVLVSSLTKKSEENKGCFRLGRVCLVIQKLYWYCCVRIKAKSIGICSICRKVNKWISLLWFCPLSKQTVLYQIPL